MKWQQQPKTFWVQQSSELIKITFKITQSVAVATAQSWWVKDGPLIIEHLHS
jgi:hypothetical protein